MTHSDIINISLSTITALTAIISIIIALVTLRQNSKMIEESTRPNIVVYSTNIDDICYIVIKNYGSSSAIVDFVLCNHDFTSEETGDFEGHIFDRMKDSIIAPGQSIRCPIRAYRLKNFDFEFTVKYHSSTKAYKDVFSFNIINNDPFAHMSASKKDIVTALQNVYVTLLELLKRNI